MNEIFSKRAWAKPEALASSSGLNMVGKCEESPNLSEGK